MELLEDTLDRISRSGEAAFAMDGGNRITHWNKACERLLGKPARQVLGKHCQDVMCGRDVNGNLYCHAACPVAHQARALAKNDPVRPFELDVAAGDGSRRRVSIALFAVPSYHPALTAVVHTLRPALENSVAPERSAEAPRPAEHARLDLPGRRRGAHGAREGSPGLPHARALDVRDRTGALGRAGHGAQPHPGSSPEARRALEARGGRRGACAASCSPPPCSPARRSSTSWRCSGRNDDPERRHGGMTRARGARDLRRRILDSAGLPSGCVTA